MSSLTPAEPLDPRGGVFSSVRARVIALDVNAATSTAARRPRIFAKATPTVTPSALELSLPIAAGFGAASTEKPSEVVEYHDVNESALLLLLPLQGPLVLGLTLALALENEKVFRLRKRRRALGKRGEGRNEKGGVGYKHLAQPKLIFVLFCFF